MDYESKVHDAPNENSWLRVALWYTKRGFKVFPLNGKAPLTPNGFKDATTDPESIRHWWEMWPEANIGINPDGFFVLDVDPRHDGDETLRTFEGEHGKLPKTATQKTGGGGRHYLFKLTAELEGLERFPKEIGAGLDLKFSNGYIVAAPSIHPESGEVYEWIVPLDAGIAPPPTWLVDLIVGRAQGGGKMAEDGNEKIRFDFSSPIPHGRRNDALASLAGSMRRRGMSQEAIEAALKMENALRCDPPLPESEVAAIARSVARYEPDPSAPWNLTDYGNAEQLVARFGEDMLYVPDWSCWLVWNDTRWVKDRSGRVERFAKETVRAMYEEASAIVEDETRKAAIKWALRSESKERIKAMVELARSEPGIPITPEELDSNQWLLNVLNGTLDLRTGELISHRREDLITKLAPAYYDPEAKAPTFQKFLERILPSEALRTFIQRVVGYSLTGDASERIFLILHGSGKNGKSTLLETIQTLLGDYAMTTPVETLLLKPAGGIPNDIARLKGARFVSASENEKSRKLAEALVKAMTGNDTISARFMRGEYFDFRPTHKLWLATNHKPEIEGTDPAIWDRIRLVPFGVRIPEEEQDKHLNEKLGAELEGILAWAVKGCLEWQKNGLTEPEEVRAATESYKEEMDPVGEFLKELCILEDGLWTTGRELREAYFEWAIERGEQALAWKDVVARLRARGIEHSRTSQERGFSGVGLNEEGKRAVRMLP